MPWTKYQTRPKRLPPAGNQPDQAVAPPEKRPQANFTQPVSQEFCQSSLPQLTYTIIIYFNNYGATERNCDAQGLKTELNTNVRYAIFIQN